MLGPGAREDADRWYSSGKPGAHVERRIANVDYLRAIEIQALEREQHCLRIGLDATNVVASDDRRKRAANSPPIEKRQRTGRRRDEREPEPPAFENTDGLDGAHQRLDLGPVAANPVREVIAIEPGHEGLAVREVRRQEALVRNQAVGDGVEHLAARGRSTVGGAEHLAGKAVKELDRVGDRAVEVEQDAAKLLAPAHA